MNDNLAGGLDACALVLSRVHAFLHCELSAEEADLFRQHLNACEACLTNVDVENTITTMLRRCQPRVVASPSLRLRVVSMTVTIRPELS